MYEKQINSISVCVCIHVSACTSSGKGKEETLYSGKIIAVDESFKPIMEEELRYIRL